MRPAQPDARDRHALRRLALLALLLALALAPAAWRAPALGAAGETPRLYFPLTLLQTGSVDVAGDVLVRPRYSLISNSRQPIEYVVVLDTSGSMSLNFAGEARYGGTVLQCGPSSDPARQAKYQQDYQTCQQTGATWPVPSERRIAVAKAALKSFVDRMQPYDAMQVIGFSARNGNGGGVGATTTGWMYADAAGKMALKQALNDTGTTNGDPYLTTGGTASATGLDTARELLAYAPKTSFDGRDFKQVVLFMTDGVANYFLKPSGNPGGFGWFNDAHDNPACKSRWDVNDAAECQIGQTATNPSIDRPITAMVNAAAAIRQLSAGMIVHAIALGDFNTAGVPDVASQPIFPYYAQALQPSQVDAILQGIDESGTTICVPQGGTTWLGTIDAAHTIVDPATRAAANLPDDLAVYGFAYLSAENGQLLQRSAIRHAAATGTLGYTFTNLAPGTYVLQAYIGYRGDDLPAPVARIYASILLPDLSHDTRRVFTVAPARPDVGIVPLEPAYLDLSGNVCP